MKNKINLYFFLLSLLLLPFVYAQELDSEFLTSLPEEVRSDVLKELGSSTVEEKTLSFPKTSITEVSKKLSDLKSDLSMIEERLLQETKQDRSDLKRFGSQFFNKYQSSFMPINEPTVSDEYIMDVGDSLKIQIVGAQSQFNSRKPSKIAVQKDGSIFIPDVGKVQVSGLTYDETKASVQNSVQSAFPGSKAFIALDELKEISVLLIGNVKAPGAYTVSGGSTVLTVLNSAGGVNEQNGSYRSIDIKRNNTLIDTIDLYEIFIFGNTKLNHRLKTGDVIIVNSRHGEVSVSGGVHNPGIYEILPEDNSLESILIFAGETINPDSKINIKRKFTGIEETSFYENPGNKFQLRNGDDVQVNQYIPDIDPIHSIKIFGEVVNPGEYSISDGEKLSSVIERAGGYTKNAYPVGGILTRQSTKKVEEETFKRNYNEMIKFIATSPNAKEIATGGGGTLPLILGEYKSLQATGRVTTEFSLSKIRRDPRLNTSLQDQDEIFVPQISHQVYVYGEVLAPGSKVFNPNLSASDYIKQAGGLDQYADKDRIVIVYPNGEAKLYSESVFESFSKSHSLSPGTLIYIPRNIGKLEGLNYASIIAPIFSSLAISLASLNSISD